MTQTLPYVIAGAQFAQGISAKNDGDRAARAALAAGNFNAGIIERDIDLLEKRRKILNDVFAVDMVRATRFFKQDVLGTARAIMGASGATMDSGSNLTVLRESAREFNFTKQTAELNNTIENMQITDQQEGARLNAQLARMEGGSAAASARAQGTASLISGFGASARTAYSTGMFS
jgi:hypothetical protein